MTPLLVLMFLGVAVAAACQALTGRGFRLVAAPVLILVCGYAEGLRLTLLVGLIFSVVMFLSERRAVRSREVLELAVPAALTAPLWVLILGLVPHSAAARIAGVVVLLAVAMGAVPWVREARWRGLLPAHRAKRPVPAGIAERSVPAGIAEGPSSAADEEITHRIEHPEAATGRARVRHLLQRRRNSIGTGAASSLMFAAGGVGGAPILVYGHIHRWAPEHVRGVLSGVALLSQLIVLTLLGFPDLVGPHMIATLVAVMVGVIGGVIAARRGVRFRLARWVTWVLAAAVAVVLVLAGTQR